MIRGSCLCNQVKFEIDHSLGPIIYCHCSRCRKSSGSAFVTSTEIKRSNFHITAGQHFVKKFPNPGAVDRFFCSECGSQLYSQREATPEVMRIRLGTIDTAFEDRVSAHIFVDSKAPWHDIADDAVQYAERPNT